MKHFKIAILALSMLTYCMFAQASTFSERIKVDNNTWRYLMKLQNPYLNFMDPEDSLEVWTERWIQDDEEDAGYTNYCGPTAGKNVLYWYGNDTVSYSTMGSKMKTNNWASGWDIVAECAKVCPITPIGPSPSCVSTCAALIKKYLIVGSLPGDVKSAMTTYTPPDTSLYFSQKNDDLEEINLALSEGNPVMVLISSGEYALHWTAVVGRFTNSSGAPYYRLANNSNLSESTFLTYWSLSKLTSNSYARKVLEGKGIKPYTMMYYAKAVPDWENEFTISGTCSLSNCKSTLEKQSGYTPMYPYMFADTFQLDATHCTCAFKDKAAVDPALVNILLF